MQIKSILAGAAIALAAGLCLVPVLRPATAADWVVVPVDTYAMNSFYITRHLPVPAVAPLTAAHMARVRAGGNTTAGIFGAAVITASDLSGGIVLSGPAFVPIFAAGEIIGDNPGP